MKTSILFLKSLILTLGFVSNMGAQCVDFYFEDETMGNQATVELKVDNFQDISTLQIAVAYFTDNLSLISVEGNSDIDIEPFQINATTPGYVTLSWTNPSTPQNLSNGSALLTFSFEILDTNLPSRIQVDQTYKTEITNGSFSLLCFTSKRLEFNSKKSIIFGNVYHDMNEDCVRDIGDLPLSDWTVRIKGITSTEHRITDVSGNYSIPVDLGEYTVEVIPINNLWENCVMDQVINVDQEEEMYEASFMMSELTIATALNVSISTPSLVRCENSAYEVEYKNNGTTTSDQTEIEIAFGDNLSYVSDNAPNLVINNLVAKVVIGELLPGESGSFDIVMNVDCDDTSLGQTICAEATINSSNSVAPEDAWNGPVIQTGIQCDQDSVRVTVTNIGDFSVSTPLNIIVVEDDVMFQNNDEILNPTESVTYAFEDKGGVYRVVADQEEGFPFGTYSTSFVESCDDDNMGTYRFVSMFPNDDESDRVDIECKGVVESLVPNNKSAYPIGYRSEHLIEANQDLEYTIRFQNTQSDTVYNMYIEDIVDPSLDISTIIAGPSSHNYTLTIEDGRKLRFDFFNILLPESATNFEASSGFVSYKISQDKDLPKGTVIGNDAQIYFDLNDPITTNAVDHQIGEDFIEIILSDENILLDNELVTAPNPANEMMRIEVPNSFENLSYILYNGQGQIVNAANSPSNVFYIYRETIKTGIYILEIRSNGRTIGSKKILFKK